MTMKEKITKAFGEDMCWACSVQMFGTDAYSDENGETVHVDYIKPENRDEYCKKHCHWVEYLKNLKEYYTKKEQN